ncbi:hypothetical protein BABINDRAFT_168739 [Babjeviella inositovora NRRL Y-12698]|uniref:AB hydrolase-1 domain-containing protein n=1 Tax=Babjeviella inositovora NRRL Y-12698 TaxID=984486 RepID=A0A1E3QJ96_9ASCO|nr:uncharacterized protein BABINDRAFT_168739 [Babjeviella inositovora NRRL Y-12698]ODQ77776.1 hypothetical protein BABINDRAFT_168739 [Babjeviella inositovora NRRL Y-12698]
MSVDTSTTATVGTQLSEKAALEATKPERRSITFWDSQKIWVNSWKKDSLLASQNELLHETLGRGEYATVDASPNPTATVNFQLQNISRPGITVQSQTVPITLYNKPGYINEVYLENQTDLNAATNVVMLHGYGAGLGHYHRNFKNLVENNGNIKVHALDLLGCGGSSSPAIQLSTKYVYPPSVEVTIPKLESVLDQATFRLGFETPEKAQRYAEGTKAVVSDIENYYVESLELWRKQQKLESFVLFGHSYGGYMASCYAHKYPNRIEKLVLLSPVGVERNALSIHNPNLFSEARVPLADPTSYDYIGRFGNGLPSWFVSAWNCNFALLGVIRSLSVAAPKVLSLYTLNRFRQPDSVTDSDAYNRLLGYLTQYCYNLYKSRSTSETAITKILSGSIMAKWPLMDRVEQYRAIKKPIYWFYGTDDWMNREAGASLSSKIGKNSEVYTVDLAGHNLHMDNPDLFNKIVNRILK